MKTTKSCIAMFALLVVMPTAGAILMNPRSDAQSPDMPAGDPFYRCRACGAMFSTGIPLPYIYEAMSDPRVLYRIHPCDDESIGLADLEGAFLLPFGAQLETP